jgi:hypothetical protein
MGDTPERRSLLESCAFLREEVARIIQESRDARRLFKRRHPDEPAVIPSPNRSPVIEPEEIEDTSCEE